MNAIEYPLALRVRLGEDGATGLAEVFEREKSEVVQEASERFDARLANECREVRMDFRVETGALRAEMKELRSDLRAEMKELRADLRAEAKELRAELKSDARVLVAESRTEILKWSFVFWVGQVVAMAGLLTALR